MDGGPLPTEQFRQEPGLEVHEVPDGYVVYAAATERVHFLNTTAALIYELCNGEHSLAEISTIVTAAFELEERAGEIVVDCVKDLLAQGLVAPCAQ
jgi:hypothetical protein